MKKSSLISAVVLTAASAMATTAFAAEKAPGSGPNPFSDCGIGAAIFSNTAWAAATSNVIWDLGTTAVTSATASPETCSGQAVKTAMFINQTYDQLVEETAKGEGEHITAMLDLAGCSSVDHAAVRSEIRSTMGTVVGDQSYSSMTHVEKASAYYDAMSQSARQHCAAAGV